jgi:hypothetical protein
MTKTVPNVGNPLETYRYRYGGGACSGITTKVFIPPLGAHSLLVTKNLNVPPLSASYAYQDAAERAVRSVLSSAPAWLSDKCFYSLRSLLCRTLLISGEQRVLADELLAQQYTALQNGFNMSYFIGQLFESGNASSYLNTSLHQNYTITVPKNPLIGVCTAFYSDCSGDMAYLWSNDSDVRAYVVSQCWSDVNNGKSYQDAIDSFAESSSESLLYAQLYAKVSSDTSTSTTAAYTLLNLTGGVAGTSVNYSALSTALFASRRTICPHGFVVPDDLRDKHNVWVGGTGCAEPCR